MKPLITYLSVSLKSPSTRQGTVFCGFNCNRIFHISASHCDKLRLESYEFFSKTINGPDTVEFIKHLCFASWLIVFACNVNHRIVSVEILKRVYTPATVFSRTVKQWNFPFWEKFSKDMFHIFLFLEIILISFTRLINFLMIV